MKDFVPVVQGAWLLLAAPFAVAALLVAWRTLLFCSLAAFFYLTELVTGRDWISRRCRRTDLSSIPQEAWPMVAVQVTCCNEGDCIVASINNKCRLRWPRSRLFIQVCDDSTDPEVMAMVDNTAALWQRVGYNIEVHRRPDRKGYKAGNLGAGMTSPRMAGVEYVAVFDADFIPSPDFLERTVPWMLGNERVAMVQARWAFRNYHTSLLTQVQAVSLEFHHRCEQVVAFCCGTFVPFNGTAGLFRVAALEAVGGWQSRTTVEDRDLSARLYLSGWDGIYDKSTSAYSENPDSLEAYRKQQFRWTAGPTSLMVLMWCHILGSPRRSAWERLNMLFWDFILGASPGFVAQHCWLFYLVIAPAGALVPGILPAACGSIAVRAAAAMAAASAVLPACFSLPWGLLRLPMWLLFENAMSVWRLQAAWIGLTGQKKANEWVVTKKSGAGLTPAAAGGSGGPGAAARAKGESCAGLRPQGQLIPASPLRGVELRAPLLQAEAPKGSLADGVAAALRSRKGPPRVYWGWLGTAVVQLLLASGLAKAAPILDGGRYHTERLALAAACLAQGLALLAFAFALVDEQGPLGRAAGLGLDSGPAARLLRGWGVGRLHQVISPSPSVKRCNAAWEEALREQQQLDT